MTMVVIGAATNVPSTAGRPAAISNPTEPTPTVPTTTAEAAAPEGSVPSSPLQAEGQLVAVAGIVDGDTVDLTDG